MFEKPDCYSRRKTTLEFNNFTFFRQKIVSLIDETEEYELLLRYQSGDDCYFPEKMLNDIVSDHKKHQLYITKVGSMLEHLFAHGTCIYSINLDYQELYFEETLAFFEKFNYKHRLKIELTERLPANHKYNESFLPVAQIKKLKEMGYVITLDDFLSGINQYKTLFLLANEIDRVKISALHFKHVLSVKELQSFLLSVGNTISFLNKQIVVEGVEDKKLLAELPNEWLRQTYYYSKPCKI